MSTVSLRTQIREDHLTCAICSHNFTKPKALPCIHTFCESCLHDYVASRGYESAPTFPCPICRQPCTIPPQGVQGFPNNHLMSSLSETVDKGSMSKPVPKPRRSIEFSGNQEKHVPEGTDVDNHQLLYFNTHQPRAQGHHQARMNISPGPDGFSIIDEAGDRGAGTSVDNSPPPPYSSVADSKVCSNDDDPGWMFVPKTSLDQSNHRGLYPTPAAPDNIGWNVQNLPAIPNMPQSQKENNLTSSGDISSQGSALYPSVPPHLFETACSNNLLLQFGKQGPTARDFIKPLGLAVNKDGHYVISDNGGDQNRIMIFNSGGEITTAFKCGAKVKDIAITQNNEIIASIDTNTSALRLFTMGGQLKGEFGTFFTFEEPCGIAELKNQGVVLTGVEGRCVYILTQQMKLATKFGRKGNGDGYFLHPGFVTVDSKNHIIVTDKVNGYVQVFNSDGKFKQRFGSSGQRAGQLHEPMGICVDALDNIIIADSGNFRVEVFSVSGQWLSSVVKDTFLLGENVRPVNVAVTPTGKVAVLLCGPYFSQVRVYKTRHQQIPQEQGQSQSQWSIPSIWYK